jgi:hypothetical protein
VDVIQDVSHAVIAAGVGWLIWFWSRNRRDPPRGE